MISKIRTRTAGMAFMLATFGFACGLLMGGHQYSETGSPAPAPPPHAHEHMPPHHRPMSRGPIVEMRFESNGGGSTVLVMQDGQWQQVGPAPEAAPAPQAPPAPPAEQESDQSGLWLSLLMLSAIGPLTWAALAWNRRHAATFVEAEPFDGSFVAEPVDNTFVPRRDD